jgi:hypothetical protein
VSLQWRVVSLGAFNAQSQRYAKLASAGAPVAKVAGNVLSYKNIFPGIDLRFICESAGLQQEFVLSQQALDGLAKPEELGLASQDAWLMVALAFEVSPGVQAVAHTASGGLQPIDVGGTFSYTGSDRIDFENADKVTQLTFPSYEGLRRFTSTTEGNLMFLGIPWHQVKEHGSGPLVLQYRFALEVAEVDAGKVTFDLERSGISKRATISPGTAAGCGDANRRAA